MLATLTALVMAPLVSGGEITQTKSFELGAGETAFGLTFEQFNPAAHPATPYLHRVQVTLRAAFQSEVRLSTVAPSPLAVSWLLGNARVTAAGRAEAVGSLLEPPPANLQLSGSAVVSPDGQLAVAPRPQRGATTSVSAAGPSLAPFVGTGQVTYDIDFLAQYTFVITTPPEGTGLFDSDTVKGVLTVTYMTGDQPPPLAVELLSFDASVTETGSTVVAWRTASEFNTLGFYVERQEAGGAWTRVNDELIPAVGGTRPQGYRLEDDGVSVPGQVRYRLVEVETTGLVTVVAETDGRKALVLDWATVDGLAALVARGFPGQTVAIEAATDAARGPWVRLGSLTLDSRGASTAPWSLLGDEPHRFYRLVSE